MKTFFSEKKLFKIKIQDLQQQKIQETIFNDIQI